MRTPILLSLPLFLAACGPSDPATLTTEGYASLGSNDYSAAVESFEAALEQMSATDPGYLRARMGHIEANTQVDPARALADFLELSEVGSQTSESDFQLVGGRLDNAKADREVQALLVVGFERYPDSQGLANLRDKVGDRIRQGDDLQALKDLEGLGYVGSD